MPEADLEFVSHLLAIFGVRGQAFGAALRLKQCATRFEQDDRRHVVEGGVLAVIQPCGEFCAEFGVSVREDCASPRDFVAARIGAVAPVLRTQHPSLRFQGADEIVLRDSEGAAVWAIVRAGRGAVLLVGTSLGQDLLRYRQGDPSAAGRQSGALWDFAMERPVYLFDAQLSGLSRAHERQADFWCMLAAETIARLAGVPRAPVLPCEAPGAVVITGDDDQAYLEKYAEQLALLGDAPITYFLHPLTRHTPETLRRMLSRRRVELGLHPDALESPQDYSRLLAEQVRWFRELTGTSALSVRNHGFLNDGYWGHLSPWIEQGIRISSNLPGLDGRPLNGSFLPARLALNGELTPHYSVVTAIGDGVRTVNGGRSDEAAGECVLACAEGIRSSGIPGVMVLNLHPQNVSDCRAMHHAALEVIRSGFLPWTMGECLYWFEHQEIPRPRSWLGRIGDRLLRPASVKEFRR